METFKKNTHENIELHSHQAAPQIHMPANMSVSMPADKLVGIPVSSQDSTPISPLVSMLVSIIVPVYNVEPYLDRCVQSLLGQTYTNLEIILVDDGSPDRCGEMCDAFARQDPRIRVIHQQNRGVSSARNTALSMAHGAYICFVDGDDWVSPWYVSHLYDAITADGADMSVACYQEILTSGACPSVPCAEMTGYEYLDTEEYLRRMLYQNGSDTHMTAKLFHAAVLQHIRFPVDREYEDVPVSYASAVQCPHVALITNADYYYWQRPDGTQNSAFHESKMDCITHFQDILQAVGQDYPSAIAAARCRYLSAVCNILFQIPDGEYQREREYLWHEMVWYRRGVLMDSSARRKARIAALLSYGGYHFTRSIYQWSQWRARYHRRWRMN